MPWCPKCKNEYVEGITECSDCGCSLVDSLDEQKMSVIFGEEEQMNRLLSFMQYNGLLSCFLVEDENENVFEIKAASEEYEKAKRISNVFLKEEAEKMKTEETADAKEKTEAFKDEVKMPSEQRIYEDSAKKAEDFKSSGYALLLVGAVGMVFLGLMFSGWLPFQLFGGTKYLSYAVMAILFILFIVFGFLSIRSSGTYRSKALTESNLKEEILSWCRENLLKESVDQDLFEAAELAEEEKYFKRCVKMKHLISQKFLNIDDAFLDALIDEFYPELFGEE